MSDEVSSYLGQFFDYMWGDKPGQAYLATIEKGDPDSFSQYMIQWPKQRDKIVRFVLSQPAEGRDIYYCPSLFVEPENTVEKNQKGSTSATRPNIQGAQAFWVDFDNGAAPQDWTAFAAEKGIPEPSIVIQSSVKGNAHAYWRTDFTTDVDAIEQVNRSLAISLGADRGGWDANQLLRPPYTVNFGWRKPDEHKGWFKGSPAQVTILGGANGTRLKTDQFANLGSAERELLDTLQLSASIPRIEEVLALAQWTPELYKQFAMDKDEASASSPDKRSGALQKLAYLAAEAGMSDEQMYSIIENADTRWDKYVRRAPATRQKILKDTIVKARLKIGYLAGEELNFAGLLGSGTQATDVPRLAYDFEEFLNTEITLEWLVEDLLAEQGIGLFTGAAGTGKTQFGMQFAIELALGRPHIIGWENKGGPKKVCMLSLEMSHAPLKKFATAMADQYLGEIRAIAKNLTIVPLGTGIDLTRPEGVSLMNNILSEYKPDVLFIDSLQKITSKPLTDEIGSKELLDALKTLRTKYNTGMYIIHHNRKKGQDPTKESAKGDLNDLYGSQYLAANLDFVYNLRKTATKGELLVDPWKNRLAEERDTFRIKRNVHLQYEIMGELEDGDEGLRIISSLRGEDSDPDEGGKTLSI